MIHPTPQSHRPRTRLRLRRKAGSSRLKCHLDLEAWVLPGEINAKENCAGYNEGPATLSSEVNVLFIELISFYDRTQDRVRG